MANDPAPPPDPRDTFGAFLVELRATLPPPLNTQDGLAEAVGVSQPAIVAWEKSRSFPSMPKLLKLAEVAAMDIADLVACRLPEPTETPG